MAVQNVNLECLYVKGCDPSLNKTHEQNTKEITPVAVSLYAMKAHTCIFTKLLPRFSRLIQYLL